MISSTPSNRSTWLLSAAALLALAASGSIVGCKSKQSAPPAPVSPTASVPSAPAAGQSAAPTPFISQHIYSETANPTADIAAALKKARAEHKRVILDFGGDWCGDCQVLDIYFHQSPNAELLAKHFVLVHVYIGHMDTQSRHRRKVRRSRSTKASPRSPSSTPTASSSTPSRPASSRTCAT